MTPRLNPYKAAPEARGMNCRIAISFRAVHPRHRTAAV